MTLLLSDTDADHMKHVCDVTTFPVLAPAGSAKAMTPANSMPTSPTRLIQAVEHFRSSISRRSPATLQPAEKTTCYPELGHKLPKESWRTTTNDLMTAGDLAGVGEVVGVLAAIDAGRHRIVIVVGASRRASDSHTGTGLRIAGIALRGVSGHADMIRTYVRIVKGAAIAIVLTAAWPAP